MSSFEFRVDGIIQNILNQNEKSLKALEAYGEVVGKELEAYAKSNRPWTDRTGEARKSLKGDSEKVSDEKVRCTISHGVDYGVFLEMCNERKYAILEPTIEAVSPKVLKGLDKIFK